MTRKIWFPALILGIFALASLGYVFIRPQTTALASGASSNDTAASAQAVTGQYLWSYAAKFVCGFQPAYSPPAPGEPVVKTGNYASEINIHNPNFKLVPIIKRFIVLMDGQLVVREPQVAGPTGGTSLEIPANSATLDDCNGIWTATHAPAVLPPNPMPPFIGYLVILSPLDINVNVVYTTNAPGIAGQLPSSSSIELLTVTGKRVFLPAGVNP